MDINFLAVILAALAAFFLGYFWYTIIFAKPWQKIVGMGDKEAGAASASQTPNLGKLLAGSFALEILMALALSTVIGADATGLEGLTTGLVFGLGFVGFAFGVNYLFEGKPLKLWLINAGYNTAVFAVMGLIIGVL